MNRQRSPKWTVAGRGRSPQRRDCVVGACLSNLRKHALGGERSEMHDTLLRRIEKKFAWRRC